MSTLQCREDFPDIILIGSELHRKLALAIPEAIIHRRAYRAFSDSLQVEHATSLKQWVKLVEEWEADKRKPCPYDLPRKGMFLKQSPAELIPF